jgi:hypothetical protein
MPSQPARRPRRPLGKVTVPARAIRELIEPLLALHEEGRSAALRELAVNMPVDLERGVRLTGGRTRGVDPRRVTVLLDPKRRTLSFPQADRLLTAAGLGHEWYGSLERYLPQLHNELIHCALCRRGLLPHGDKHLVTVEIVPRDGSRRSWWPLCVSCADSALPARLRPPLPKHLRKKPHRRISPQALRAAAVLHEHGFSVAEIARRSWQSLGYQSEAACASAFADRLREKGLELPRSRPKLSEREIRRVHREHLAGTRIRDLAASHWQEWGYRNAGAARASLVYLFSSRDLQVNDRTARKRSRIALSKLQLDAAYALYLRDQISLREVAELHWRRWRFPNSQLAASVLARQWREGGYVLRDQRTAVAIARERKSAAACTPRRKAA